ncbi:hypothetical protein M5D96_005091 [Drosophila gunungcola]|uniref:Fibrinogen C-terminal domain-containing protein n=2 Tax=Drosophila gunungcola TaxID=103775 RepID=A0A9P9YVP6_9MUSC|nr:hypothetical protein M5D96_005091 [Drosophila gunungcola]
MTIQKRFDGSLSFDRKWEDYKIGFGHIQSEFFIGLEAINRITERHQHELLISITDINGQSAHALYENFQIGRENEGYALKSLGKYSGLAGDFLSHQLHKKFTTLDKNNDANYNLNCARDGNGGYWYNGCMDKNLNAKYYASGFPWGQTMLRSIIMMIRPK